MPGTSPGAIGFPVVRPIHLKCLASVRPDFRQLRQAGLFELNVRQRGGAVGNINVAAPAFNRPSSRRAVGDDPNPRRRSLREIPVLDHVLSRLDDVDGGALFIGWKAFNALLVDRGDAEVIGAAVLEVVKPLESHAGRGQQVCGWGSGTAVNIVESDVRISKLIKNLSNVVGIRFDKEIRLRGRALPWTTPGAVSFPMVRPIHFKCLASVRTDFRQLRKAAHGPVNESIAVGKTLNIAHVV